MIVVVEFFLLCVQIYSENKRYSSFVISLLVTVFCIICAIDVQTSSYLMDVYFLEWKTIVRMLY